MIATASEVPGARLLTPDEVCLRLGVRNQTLANWRYRGIGPHWTKISGEVGKPGGRVGYPPSALEAYIAARTVEPRETVPA